VQVFLVSSSKAVFEMTFSYIFLILPFKVLICPIMPLKCVYNWVTFVHLAGFAAACSSRVVHRGDKVVISK
jgi:hypothetical protein